MIARLVLIALLARIAWLWWPSLVAAARRLRRHINGSRRLGRLCWWLARRPAMSINFQRRFGQKLSRYPGGKDAELS
ncbi:MAG: hypothetical protein AB1631_28400 [Acidobacteriota bacterium]